MPKSVVTLFYFSLQELDTISVTFSLAGKAINSQPSRIWFRLLSGMTASLLNRALTYFHPSILTFQFGPTSRTDIQTASYPRQDQLHSLISKQSLQDSTTIVSRQGLLLVQSHFHRSDADSSPRASLRS